MELQRPGLDFKKSQIEGGGKEKNAIIAAKSSRTERILLIIVAVHNWPCDRNSCQCTIVLLSKLKHNAENSLTLPVPPFPS